MPKLIDVKVRAPALRLVLEHCGEYPTVSKALEAVPAKKGGQGIAASMGEPG